MIDSELITCLVESAVSVRQLAVRARNEQHFARTFERTAASGRIVAAIVASGFTVDDVLIEVVDLIGKDLAHGGRDVDTAFLNLRREQGVWTFSVPAVGVWFVGADLISSAARSVGALVCTTLGSADEIEHAVASWAGITHGMSEPERLLACEVGISVLAEVREELAGVRS